jgi:hypothetical protein
MQLYAHKVILISINTDRGSNETVLSAEFEINNVDRTTELPGYWQAACYEKVNLL